MEGYVAARECNRVHVLRPSSSTSGGHSGVAARLVTVAAAAAAEVLLPGPGFVEDFIIASQSAEDVHVRQLQENDQRGRALFDTTFVRLAILPQDHTSRQLLRGFVCAGRFLFRT